MTRARRWLWRLPVWFVLLPLLILTVVLVAGLAALQMPPVQRLLAETIGDAASSDESGLRIGGIEGFVPFDFRVTDIALTDADGAWMTIDRAQLSWSPTALASGRLQVAALTAGTVHVLRPPLPGPATTPPEPDPSEPFRLSDLTLPELPVAVQLDRLAIDEIRLEEPVFGQPAVFGLAARALVPTADGPLRAELDLERLDGEGGVQLDLAFTPETRGLSLDLSAREPTGGLLARAAALPEQPPISLRLRGTGPITDWSGRLDAEAGPDLGANGDVHLREDDDGLTLSVDLAARLTTLIEDSLDPLIAGGITLDGAITYDPEGAIGWQDLRLVAAAGRVTTTGRLEPVAGTITTRLAIEAGAPDSFTAFLPPGVGWDQLGLEAEAHGSADAMTVNAIMEGAGLTGPADAGAVGPTIDALRLDVSANGPVRQPTLVAELTAGGLAAGAALGVEDLQAILRATPRAALDQPDADIEIGLNVAMQGTALADPKVTALLDPELRLQVAGTIGLDGRAAPLSVTVTTPVAELAAEATVQGWGAEANGSVNLDVPTLGAFADLAGLPLQGALQAAIELETVDGLVRAGLNTVLTDAVTGIAQADAVLGPRATLTGAVEATPDGAITLTGLMLDAAGTRLEADRISLADALEAGLTVDLPDLSAIDPGLAGRAQVTVNATGPLDGLTVNATVTAADIEAGGEAVPEAVLQASVTDPTGSPAGDVTFEAVWRDQPIGLETAYAIEEAGLRLDGLNLTFADARVSGNVTADFAGTVDGRLAAAVPDLGAIGAVANLPVTGAADLSLDLSTADGLQGAAATLELTGAQLPGVASLAGARVTATVTDALGAPSVQADLSADGIEAAGMALTRLAVGVAGNLSQLDTTIRADGPDLALDTAATLGLADEDVRIAIARLTGRYLSEPLALAGPATVTLAGSAVAIDGLRLTARDGAITVDGRYDPSGSDLSLRIDRLPLALADLANPDLRMGGRLDGGLTLRGTQTSPEAQLDLRATEITLAALREQGFGALTATVNGGWSGRRLALDSVLTLPDDSTVRAQASLPLLVDPASGAPALPPNAELTGALTGEIDLAIFNTMLAATADRVEGQAQIDIALSGPVEEPRADGDLRVSDGVYENTQIGVLLEQIGLTLTAEDSHRFVVRELSARTLGGGTITGEGTIDLAGEDGMPVDIGLSLRAAHLIESELLTVILNGDLGFVGDLAGEAAISGDLAIQRAEFRIPHRMPSSVPTLDVREVNLPSDRAAAQEAEERAAEEPATALALALDIGVSAQQQIYVRGRGADLELGGALRVRGTADSPRITGQLNTQRGTLDLLGKRFVFDRGTVAFNGEAAIDPSLDFLATTEAEGITGGVQILGRASGPSLSFVSDPPFPEDEILARLLFGRSPTDLSPAQAIELASAAAELSGVGGGGNIMARIRDTLQLDRLEIQEGDDEGTELSAGRYVSDGVFVGVDQNLTAGTSRVTVEVELTPNISVETDIGSDSTGRVGVNFEWDY